MSNSTFDVFISYSHRDAEWVRDWLLPRLEAAGLRVCIDFRDFELGVPSLDNMEDAVEQSRKTLLVMTPAWVESEWTRYETLLTQTEDPSGLRRRTLPLMLEKCRPPKRIGMLTHADFTDASRREDELPRLVEAIREESSRGPALAETKAPTQHLVHPYPLQANFTGRVQERGELTAWLADDARPVCALVAMGGMGKSALAWVWVTNDVLNDAQLDPPVDGVMWWSFYEGESSFARFIDEALRYVGDRPIDAALFPTTYDRAQELRRLLQTKRILFVLDGFERQLRAYASLDAAYKQDASTDPSRESRSCVDPTAMRFIRDIAAGPTRAKLLLTTRLMPSDLEDRAGDPLAGALKRELKELPRDDALTFMRAQGVTKGTDAELIAACAAYGYHPLSLRLLSGLIARDTRAPGDIAAAPRHDVHADLIQRQHHVLEQSYNALPKRERAILSRIAAFRSPMDYDALSIFNTLGNEARFGDAIEDLRARGLLQRDFADNRYDLHPIVRRYAYDRLNNKKNVHIRLRDYFAHISTPDEDNVQNIEDLASVIELYHHTVGAGRYDEGHELYRDRLSGPLYFRFGAYQIEIELLRGLFPDGESHPPRLKKIMAQGWTLNALASSYGPFGQLRNAERAFRAGIAIAEKSGDKKNLAIGLNNIANTAQIGLGALMTAEQNLRRSIELCRETNNDYLEANAHHELARLLSYCGRFNEAALESNVAFTMIEEMRAIQAIGTIWAYRALHSLLMLDAKTTVAAARQAYDIAISARNEHDTVYAEWLLAAALILEGRDLNAAASHLTDAITRCRRINLVELEPGILLTWARWHQASDNMWEAHTHAEEALAIADRCEFRLAQAEIRNFLARVALDAGERDVAREHAEVARERAWCDGPPHCYRVALDEAEALLRELGAGEGK